MDDKEKKGTGIGTVGGAAAGGIAGGATTGALAGGLGGPAGAAIGAAVGAGVGALSGKKAGDAAGSSGTSGSGSNMHTVIGVFNDESGAQRALERVVQGGIPRHDVHLERQQGATQSRPQAEPQKKSGGFFASLFGMDDDYDSQRQSPYGAHADTYDEAVRRGNTVVVVDTMDENQADTASRLLHEAGAIDVDEHSQKWRAEGWQPRTTGTTGTTGTAQNLTARDTQRTGQEGTLDVVQEELQVGKRTMDRGGVRVVQRVSSKPIREVVRLREEHAVVERRPVDRPATGQDLSNFKEGMMEVRESVEEPVVAKTARVVEEVRVGKEVREREETIEDSVRRKDVEVQRVAGQTGRTERERAVARDDDPTLAPRRTDKDRPL